MGKEDEALPRLTFHTLEEVSERVDPRTSRSFQNVKQLYLP